MSSTNPYFIRHQLGNTPGNNGGSFSACPDIVFSTNGSPNFTPQTVDPTTLVTDAAYGTDFGSTIQVGTPQNPKTVNYVYLRALNTTPSNPVPTRFWFMYTQSNLFMWPQNWWKTNIQVGNQQAQRCWQDGSDIVAVGKYIVTKQPFIWTPQAPDSGQHFCAISMAEPFPDADPPGSLSSPPFAPPGMIGHLSTVEELSAFVLGNDWFGWRNTIDVSTLGQTWQQVIPVTGPDQAGQVNVGIQCINMPTDGYVSATMQGPDQANSLNLPKTPIRTSNMNIFVPVTLPASYQTNMIITYWQGSTTPPGRANIVPLLQLPGSVALAALKGRPPRRAATYSRLFDNVTMDFLGWQKVYTIGSVPLSWAVPPSTTGLVAVPRSLPEALHSKRDLGASWQRSWDVAGPPDGGRFLAGIRCTHMPTDGQFAIEMAGPDPAQGIDLPPTAISDPNEVMLFPLDWPAGFESKMVVTYWQGATPLPPAAEISPVVQVPSARAAPMLESADAPPTWQETVPITGPDQGGPVYAGIACRDMPTDGFVAFQIPQPNGILVGRTRIAAPNMTLMAQLNWPAHFETEMTISYWEGRTQPPPGASITAQIYVLEEGGGAWQKFHRLPIDPG